MYTVSFNSIRFHYLIITFACLPLLALLLSTLLSRSGLAHAKPSNSQSTPPTRVPTKLQPPPDLPMMKQDSPWVTGELPLDTRTFCIEMDQISNIDLCNHIVSQKNFVPHLPVRGPEAGTLGVPDKIFLEINTLDKLPPRIDIHPQPLAGQHP